MKKEITEEVIENFLKTISRKSCDKMTFYSKLFKFLDNGNFFVKNEVEIERLAYKIAGAKDYLGYEVLSVIENIQDFADKMNRYIDKVNYFYFHFIIENKDESELCLSEIWEKWHSKPAMGWLGGWCDCGKFYPYTLDLGATITEDYTVDQSFSFKPRAFSIKEVKKIELCSDSNVRFTLDDGTIIAGRPFKQDMGFNFNFGYDPLSIL